MNAAPSDAAARIGSGPVLWTNLLIVWIVWGSTYMGIRFATESIPPFIAGGTRLLAAFALMVVITAVIRGPRALRVSPRECGTALFLGFALLAVGLGTVGLAQAYVPTGVMALIIASTPLTIVIWRAITGDRPPALTLIGVAVGLAGIAWMLLPGGTRPVSGTEWDVVVWSLIVLCSATIWATASFFSGRMPTPRDNFVLTTYELLGGGVVLLMIGLLQGEQVDVADITLRSWAGWLFLVIAGSVIAFSSFTWLINRAPISLASTYAYVNPVVAVILGLLLYGEALTSDVVVGLTVVLGGVVLVVSAESIRARHLRSRGAPAIPETEVT